jgi:thiosulfate dehydrogenase (quinone) large subunit
MTNENNDQGACRAEHTMAFLLLRAFLGVRTLMAGIEKFETRGTYSIENYGQNMNRMAQGITSASFLPLPLTTAFAQSLGYALVVLGVAVLLGVKTRLALLATGFLYVGLSFGLMAVQESEGVAWLATYITMFAIALVLSRHDRFAVWADKR